MAGPRLDGKVVIVTGGTQGLGASIAGHCAAIGAAGLVTCGRQRAKGEARAKELTAKGCPAHFVEADLSDVSACRRVVAACVERFKRVDGLVNAAGITDRGSIEDSDEALWDRMIAINTRAPFFLMQEAVRAMKRANRGGAIVNILSISGHGGQPYLAPYVASKAALGALTKNAAHALRFARIRVNAVNMGWTATDNEHATQRKMGRAENWLEEEAKKQPFGRILVPEDVARLAGYLLSDDSVPMTGSIIDYDQRVIGAYD